MGRSKCSSPTASEIAEALERSKPRAATFVVLYETFNGWKGHIEGLRGLTLAEAIHTAKAMFLERNNGRSSADNVEDANYCEQAIARLDRGERCVAHSTERDCIGQPKFRVTITRIV